MKKAQIMPSNQPSGGYSYKNGYPIINFSIARGSRFLDGKSIRFNGSLTLRNSAGNPIINKITDPPAVPISTASDVNGIALSNNLGISSLISQITIATNDNQTMDTVRNYNRVLLSKRSVLNSQSDYDSMLTQYDPTISSRSFNGAYCSNNTVNFSIPLSNGLLNKKIPLDKVGGVNISLELASDASVISGYNIYVDPDPNFAVPIIATNPGSGAYYTLNNVSLSCNLIDYDPTQKLPAEGSISFDAISSLYSVVNSSNQTIAFNLGNSNVKSVSHIFTKTNQLNDYGVNGFQMSNLKNNVGDAVINQVSFLKNGVLFPLQYELDNAVAGNDNRPQSVYDIQFINSISSYSTLNHCLMSPQTNFGLNTGLNIDNTPVVSQTLADPLVRVFGLGVLMDSFGAGVDFKNSQYSLNITSNLDGISENSMFSFVKSQNVLTYDKNGIMIIT
jgi:hypothetical protein